MPSKTVSIRPGVGVLSVLQHLKYKIEFAFAEFIDNALDSASRYYSENDWGLDVHIELDAKTGVIIVRDNAFGISIADFPRAFKPASPPSHVGGLSEFGMGMKSAACWFSNEWSVRTTVLDDVIEREVKFNVATIVETNSEELVITSTTVSVESHYTVVTLSKAGAKMPRTRGLSQLKLNLASIYRVYLRNGKLRLFVNGELLSFIEPEVLEAPYYRTVGVPTGTARRWTYPIDIVMSSGKTINGFLALRKEGSTKSNGIYLFRRGRVIKGSDEIPYRPAVLYGSSNSYRSQRLFGELHLTGYDVTHTKDDFRHDAEISTLLEIVREDLNSTEFPMLKQAENYRTRATEVKYDQVLGKTLTRLDADEIDLFAASAIASANEEASVVYQPVSPTSYSAENGTKDKVRHFTSSYEGYDWKIEVILSYDQSLSNLYDLLQSEDKFELKPNSTSIVIRLRINMSHKFIVLHYKVAARELEPLVTFLVAMAIAEEVCNFGPKTNAWTLRYKLNNILSTVQQAK